MKTEFMMKRLGNMINNEHYDLPERYAPSMLDAGYIVLVRSCEILGFGVMSGSFYQATDEGEKAYLVWVKTRKEGVKV